jgi:NhaP-type Na+/H+ or K+/H+ antiporter
VLVVVTMAAVSLTAQALGMDPRAAWVLGAVLAPTDAAAVAGLAKRLPRRTLTTLRAESLINDGTALVLYAVAVAVAVGDMQPSPVLQQHFELIFPASLVDQMVAGMVE